MSIVKVHLKDRSYQIVVDRPVGDIASHSIWKTLLPSKLILITSRALDTAGHHARVRKALKSLRVSVESYVLPNGEQAKTLSTLNRLYEFAFRVRADRRTVVVALGGGVVTDLAGFFAATYMRGLSLISVPTTLLGMVDASIGGKTGIDLPAGKNLVGAFWQPRLVWVDGEFLKTLPDREWRTGMAEVVKYGVIQSRSFFKWLERQSSKSADPKTWGTDAIRTMLIQSIQAKAIVVSQDEHETPLAGGREILNFGHTIGHALEAAGSYRRFTHGEAISIGMVAVGRIALAKGMWHSLLQDRLIHLLSTLKLPVQFPRLSAGQNRVFWKALMRDKKHIGGHLRFVLPKILGTVIVLSGIPVDAVQSAIQEGHAKCQV